MSQSHRTVARVLTLTAVLVGVASGVVGCSWPLHRQQPLVATQLSPAQSAWVESTLASMSLRDKAGQLLMVRAPAQHYHPDSVEMRSLLAEVRELGVGGVVIFDADLESIPRLVTTLQQAAPVPLLVASDFEQGLAFRVRRGASQLPSAMALGATRSLEAARFAGEVTGRESRAVGVHWTFSPVADVNNNPANPVINTRSFGEDPGLVGGMAAAYIEGLRSTGVLSTAKHFPGHGDTAVDSHYALPVLEVGRKRLQSLELAPFRRAIAAGADAVMTAHLAVPALDSEGTPASMSRALTHDLLREDLDFEGLIVTDAMEMKGAGVMWAGGAVVEAIRAGADVALMPLDAQVAVQSIVRAVAEGQLTQTRVDEAARRVLRAKAALGLHLADGAVKPQWNEIARPEDQDRIAEIAAEAVTLVRNRDQLVPIKAEERPQILHLVTTDSPWLRPRHRFAQRAFESRGLNFESRDVPPAVAPEQVEEILALAETASHVIVSAYVRAANTDEDGALSASQVELLDGLRDGGKPLVLLSFGSPYLLSETPWVPSYVAAYGAGAAMQRATVAAILGEADITGRLPVTLPELYAYDHGLELAARPMDLPQVDPTQAGFRPNAMAEVDAVVEDFLAQGAFPGAVLAVGNRGKLAHLKGYGRLTYDPDAPPVTAGTIYDLASLTKVAATTMMAMILFDEGHLDLDAPVQDFLPGFIGEGKEKVTVHHLLTHSSGVDWWGPLYETLDGKAEYLERIQAMPLVYEPGSESVYSDLGMFLLGEILERVAGQPLDRFVGERVYEPLSMTDTLFNPGTELRQRIAPTEEDADWRGRLVHGEVHDENARALGGVAPHAGLFGTAGDLATLAQMLLNGGVFEHQRIVSAETVDLFTQRAGIPDSDRALGWDTRSAEGSSSGRYFSEASYGHLGFTGTSMWIDPQRKLFVILLTNRVHPTRDNNLIRKARPAVADAVVEGLTDGE